MDRLYRELKLTRVRPVSAETAVGSGIEPVNDNSDPNVADLSKFNFEWKRLDAHVDYMTRARERGADTFFLSPLNRESWMGTSTANNDAAEYGEWLMAQVRRSAERGVRLPYLSVGNEPSYGRNTMSGEFIRDVIKNVGPRLRAEGFDTVFVTPDDVRSSNAAAKARVILADPVARQYVGALATHLYDEPVSNVGQMEALAQQYQLPLWMTEFSLSGMGSAGRPANAFAWASLMHELISNYDVSAIDYMWGFFGEWDRAQLITLNHTGATYDGYTLNKVYYTMGQFSRFVEPGAQRIRADSSDATVQTTAYLNDDGDLVIVAINAGSSNQQVTFNLNGLPDVTRFDGVRTSASENWAALPPITAAGSAGSAFSAVLPHNSVTTFTADLPAVVLGRHVFYNNSAFDGNEARANSADDAAVATDKQALLPGGTATFLNYTGYSRGINGIMVDVAGLPSGTTLTADDFIFRVGSSNNPSSWAAAPAPVEVVRRDGAGASGSSRVTLVWPDGSIQRQWLQVTVKANGNTGLAAPDAFYFGNLPGDINGGWRVDGSDFALLASNFGRTGRTFGDGDLNGDRRVDGSDFATLAGNFGRTMVTLQPPAAPVTAVLASAPPSAAQAKRAESSQRPAPRRATARAAATARHARISIPRILRLCPLVRSEGVRSCSLHD